MSAFPMARNALSEDMELVLSNSKILSLPVRFRIVLNLLLFYSEWNLQHLGSVFAAAPPKTIRTTEIRTRILLVVWLLYQGRISLATWIVRRNISFEGKCVR
jgi:hypothetical protein